MRRPTIIVVLALVFAVSATSVSGATDAKEIYLNEDETLVAFTKAEDFRGGEFPFTNGVAVYNLKTGEVRGLLTKKGETIGNYGWVGDQLLIDLPGDDGFEPLLLDLDGNLTPFYNGPLLPLVRKWPKRSFDGRFPMPHIACIADDSARKDSRHSRAAS